MAETMNFKDALALSSGWRDPAFSLILQKSETKSYHFTAS